MRGPGGLLVYEGKGTFEMKEDKKAAPKQVKVNQGLRVLGIMLNSVSSFLHTCISGEASEHDCWWHRDHTNASIGEDFFNLWCEHCIPVSMLYVNIATAAN